MDCERRAAWPALPLRAFLHSPPSHPLGTPPIRVAG